MTKQELASVVLKLMAIYVIVVQGPMLLIALTASGGLSFLRVDPFSAILIFLFKIVLPVLYLILCVWVIRRSDAAAERVFPENGKLVASTTLDMRDVQAIAYSCVGLLVLANAAPKVINLAGVLSFKLTSPSYRYWESYSTTLPQILGAFAQAIIGLYLVFYPQGFTKLWLIANDHLEDRKLRKRNAMSTTDEVD
jgi:hypothetical protein